jgi:threonine dehydrogenase-like Zn-dependent dehydrogenase
VEVEPMKALTWHGKRDIRFEEVPDPTIQQPDDLVIRVTSTAICGSDLHLYEVLGPFMGEGDVVGHEPMGIVEAVGPDVQHVQVGDRVVIPFNISCGSCFMCTQGLESQCETTQVHAHGTGAALFGYSKLYGQVPGGQAEYLRVPCSAHTSIPVPAGPPDDRFLFLSDVLPTAWQAVRYADAGKDGTLVILGQGPIGAMAARIAMHESTRVIAVDLVPERLDRARTWGVEALDLAEHGDDLGDVVRELTDGRGPDAVIDAVGMEAHGSPGTSLVQKMASLLPDPLQAKLMERGGVDRLNALYTAIDLVRRGGTISLSGVYGGMADPLPMLQLFDKQVQLRMGQANVMHWIPEILPLLADDDPLGVDTFATHHLPLAEGPQAYETFQAKQDGAIKIVLNP